MSDESERSLSDDQIKTDYRTDQDFLPDMLRNFAILEQRADQAKDQDEIVVPAAALQSVRMGVRALLKSQSEIGFVSPFGDSGDRGDQGSHCDYNPFIKVNIGDL